MPPRGSPDRMGASAVVLYRACRVRAAPRCSAPSYYACARPTKGGRTPSPPPNVSRAPHLPMPQRRPQSRRVSDPHPLTSFPRRRESRVGLGGGASPSPVLPTHPRGDPAALPLQGRRASDPAKAGIQGGGAGHPLTLPCHPSVARTSTYVLVSPQHAKQAKEVAMPRKTNNILRPVQLHFSAEKNRWQSYRRQQSNRAHRLNLRCG